LINATFVTTKIHLRRISADPIEGTSVLVCQIETGRTHQIRVHLQYLGFPVLNDNIYNDTAWGPAKGKGGDYGGKTVEQVSH
jgi:23S rRNA-/tRNA-specific pseudouridylate synthase